MVLQRNDPTCRAQSVESRTVIRRNSIAFHHGAVTVLQAFLEPCDLGKVLNNGFTGKGTPEFHFRSTKCKKQGADHHCGIFPRIAAARAVFLNPTIQCCIQGNGVRTPIFND